MFPQYTPKDIERFWSHVDKSNDCWIWTAGIRGGYGRFRIGKRMYSTHILSYLFTFGKFPEDLFVLHKCDNPPCCNPSHLFVGTKKDNMQDMLTKGRGNKAFGTRHGMVKLTEDQVKTILDLLSENRMTHLAIANLFGVCKATVTHIHTGRLWSHLHPKNKLNDDRVEIIDNQTVLLFE